MGNDALPSRTGSIYQETTMNNLRVLFIGLDPATMEFAGADEVPTVIKAAKLQAIIDGSIAELRGAGYDVDWLPIGADANAEISVRAGLHAAPYDCVVIGAGIRLFKEHTALFESLINLIHGDAPSAKMAFNSTPADTLLAVQRQLAVNS